MEGRAGAARRRGPEAVNAAGMGESAERPAGFFPIVDDELRRLAAARLAYERPGHSNDAIAPVPEAYLRLVGGDPGRPWHGGALFFAAAEAMRRILVNRARGKAPLEADGAPRRLDIDDFPADVEGRPDRSLVLDEALTELERHDETAARFIKLRCFAGMSRKQAADSPRIGRRAADRLWTRACAWLLQRLGEP